MSGILSGPIDLNGSRKSPRGTTWPTQPAEKGVVVRHRTTGYVGPIIKFTPNQVTIADRRSGRQQTIPVTPGAFSVKGKTVTLVKPAPKPTADNVSLTASGSVALPKTKARVALPSRILVEGLHDAELVEKVWGDDLRIEGVVVEPLHGADDLSAVVAEFNPAGDRRLGILLDHLVSNSKETRIAETISNPHVCIAGHPYVDVWQAIRPGTIGIEKWPVIERGTDWKTGICQALGFHGEPGLFWKLILAKVSSYTDLEPGLIGAVEQLIDFVAPPPSD